MQTNFRVDAYETKRIILSAIDTRTLNLHPIPPPQMNPPTKLTVSAALFLAAFSSVAVAQTLFEDDFNRSDSTNLGTGWTEDNDSGAEASISTNELLLSVPTASNLDSRAIVQTDLAANSSQILPAGGFEISFDFTPGVDWTSGPHGGYGLRVYLGPQSFAENVNAGFGNNNFGLRFQIAGNGIVTMRDENGNVGSPTSVDGWTNLTPKSLGLRVETDSFGTTGGNNSASLTIGGTTVFDGVPFGEWTAANDLFVAVEAFSASTVGSSTVDNFAITAIPEPNALALLAGLGATTVVAFRRRVRQ